jgi:hypothetical protein
MHVYSSFGKWCGYPKDQPHYQAHGEVLEEQQLKLQKPYGDLSQATPSKFELREKTMGVTKYLEMQNGTLWPGRKANLKTKDYANSPQISPSARSTSSKKYGRDNVKRSDLNGASVMSPVVERYQQSPCWSYMRSENHITAAVCHNKEIHHAYHLLACDVSMVERLHSHHAVSSRDYERYHHRHLCHHGMEEAGNLHFRR